MKSRGKNVGRALRQYMRVKHEHNARSTRTSPSDSSTSLATRSSSGAAPQTRQLWSAALNAAADGGGGGGAPISPTAPAALLRDIHLSHSSPSELQHQLVEVVREAPSTRAVERAFALAALNGDEAVSPALVRAACCATLRLNLERAMGKDAASAALDDLTGRSVGGERWSRVSPAEERAALLYQAAALHRYATRGTSFNPDLGVTEEGADNQLASLVELSLRRQQRPVPVEVLADLVHMDIGWTRALRLYDYAGETLGGTLPPPVEMAERVMGLMTGYRTNGLGSRPWQRALAIYERTRSAGYETTLRLHTHALDALWRSAANFHRPHHRVLDPRHTEFLRTYIERIRGEAEQLRVAGDDGCAYVESLVKATAASGDWQAAVALVLDTDRSPDTLSFRLLVPSAETFAFAIAACAAARNATHVESLYALFRSQSYSLRSLHPEALLVLLQSLRHVVPLTRLPAELLTELLSAEPPRGRDNNDERTTRPLLDRPCAVACLQLLSMSRVRPELPLAAATRDGTAASSSPPYPLARHELATRACTSYDANPWLQQPEARKAELQTVFRCLYLIDALTAIDVGERPPADTLVGRARAELSVVFGAASPEVEWLNDTEVYELETCDDWRRALDIFERHVTARPPERLKNLPIPLRQTRQAVVGALLRSVRASHAVEQEVGFLLDDEAGAEERSAAGTAAAEVLCAFDALHRGSLGTVPHRARAELLLWTARYADTEKERRRLAQEALLTLGAANASEVSSALRRTLAGLLSDTEERVDSIVIENHRHLRAEWLDGRLRGRHLLPRGPPCEAQYW